MKRITYAMQKYFFYIYLMFSLSNVLQAQQVMTIRHSCSFDGNEKNKEYYVDEASKEAKAIVAKIMDAYVLQPNFILKAADCKNALATSDGVNRYILYSTHFLENFKKDAKTQWAAYCVLAHEIGHHLNNHNLAETDSKKRKIQELQADKFAGGILYNLGATLDEAQAGIQSFSLENESETHPQKKARLESVAQGWVQAKEKSEERQPQPVVNNDNKPIAQQIKQTKFTEVSSLVAENFYGKWTTGQGIIQVFEIFNNNKANLTTTYTIGNTTQSVSYKWDYTGGVFTRQKIFPNGSLGSPEKFSLSKLGEDTLIMTPYKRAGESFTWKKIK